MAEEQVVAASVQPEVKPVAGQAPAAEAQAVDNTPKFTQKQLNDLIAKEAGTRESKLLEQLGVKSADEIAAIRKKLDEGKTDEQRRAEMLEAEKKRADELDGKSKSSDLVIELLALGLDKESARKYAKFAAEEAGESAEDKAKAFIAGNAGLVKKPVPSSLGVETRGSTINEQDAILGELKKRFKIT